MKAMTDIIIRKPELIAEAWSDLLNGTAPDNNKVSFYQNDGSIKYKFNTPTNHAVTLIGWDDNYSYTNFKTKPSSYDGKDYNYENGAWIVREQLGKRLGQ